MVQQINILKEEMRGVEFSLRTRARYAFLRQAVLSSARAADAVLVQSEVMRDRLLRLEARLDGRIHVIPSGFRSRLDRWQVREEIRSQFDGDGERKLIMYPSYPRPHKNYERLFEAWRQVSEQLPEWRLGLTLASFPAESGSGATSGGGSAKIRNGSMKNSILMLGALNPAEVDFVLRHSAAMVFPSLSESFGLPLAEAMHAGCPIAAADLAYAREVADRAAIYFDPYDVSSIARAMLRIATDNGLRDCLRREGHLREPMYDYNTIAEQYCHLIERLTGTGGLRTGEQSTGNK